ncbi:MAG: efflux transporter, family, subunit protein [Phycisphaerales bacterium]|nr:efflux transporter, family, subunit protein [Phycisphaerales bacterium]MDB5304584.1 efflux transporter, family, subunit protein [Phycisphaerales bacterium]
MVRWVVIVACVLAAAVAGLTFFWLSRPLVTVTRVVEGPAVESFYATGTVQPVTEHPVRTSNVGIVAKILVDKGDHVTKGQPLAEVFDPQLQFQLDKARAELEHQRQRADDKSSPVLHEFDSKLEANAAMLDNAKRDEQRFAEMAAKGGAAFTDRDKAADRAKELWSAGESLKAQRATMKLQLASDLSVAEAAEAAARRNFDLQTLRSPIDGVVLDRPVPIGTRLNVNDHVMQLADVRQENLVMRAAVDEENIAQVQIGQLVHMSLYSFAGLPLKGKVSKVYDKADADRRTFEVDVRVEAPKPEKPDDPPLKLAAGMTGELAFVSRAKDRALIAPAQAFQGGAFYTVHGGRLTKLADVTPGIRGVEWVELASGLRVGDTIVISPVSDLTEGANVRVTKMEPTAAAMLNKPKAASGFTGFH